VLGISGSDMRGIVFGEHGDSMVASPRFFSVSGVPLEHIMKVEGIDAAQIKEVMENAKKGGTHFVNETGQSASAGPARAACDMLRAVISGEAEVQPVVAILEKEYGLLKEEDALDSLAFGVPARIGPYGVEKIYELDLGDLRGEIEHSTALIMKDITAAAGILKTAFGIE